MQLVALKEDKIGSASGLYVATSATGAIKQRMWAVQLFDLQVGDILVVSGFANATNPYSYNAGLGIYYTLTADWDGEESGWKLFKGMVRNVTPEMHHDVRPYHNIFQITQDVLDFLNTTSPYLMSVGYAFHTQAQNGDRLDVDPYGGYIKVMHYR